MSSPSESATGPALGHPARGRLFGDRRGLTVSGAVVLVLLVGVAGGAYDVATGSGLRLVFAACFVTGSALAALLVHREDLRAAALMPPLTYVVLAVGGSAAEGDGAAGGFVSKQALGLLNAVVLGAPVLVAATLAAVVIVLLRAIGSRPA